MERPFVEGKGLSYKQKKKSVSVPGGERTFAEGKGHFLI